MVLSAVLFLASFLFYLVTLTGTVPVYRDSGDMINAIYTLGVAHPPGYPLYVALGKIFTTLLPFANIAYRVNVFSAVCAASTVCVLYPLARRQTSSGPAALAVSLFVITPAMLSLARVSEMYALAGLFGSGILASFVAATPSSRLLGCFLIGLGFGVHPTLLFFAPLFFTLKPKDILFRSCFFTAGFSIVLMLMLRAQQDPLQNWGNPSTWEELWRLITRSNYGGLKLHPGESQFSWTAESIFMQLQYFGRSLLKQWSWMGLVAGLAGLVSAWRQATEPRDQTRLIICWLMLGPLFFVLSNLPLQANTTGAILEPYLVLVNVIWALWLARGLQQLINYGPNVWIRGVIVLVLLVLPAVRLTADFRSQRQDFYAYDLARNLFRSVPARAVFYDPDDPIAFTLRNLQLTEKRREDVVLLNFFRTFWGYKQLVTRWPDFLPPAPVRSAQDLEALFWKEAIKRRNFYAELPVKIPQHLTYKVEGLVCRILAKPEASDRTDLHRAEAPFPFYVWRGAWRTTEHSDFFTRQILNYRASAYCNLGLKFAENRDWIAARRYYYQALTIDPQLSAAYNNLGVADYQQGLYRPAVQNYQLAIRFDPQNAGYRQNLELAQAKTAKGVIASDRRERGNLGR